MPKRKRELRLSIQCAKRVLLSSLVWGAALATTSTSRAEDIDAPAEVPTSSAHTARSTRRPRSDTRHKSRDAGTGAKQESGAVDASGVELVDASPAHIAIAVDAGAALDAGVGPAAAPSASAAAAATPETPVEVRVRDVLVVTLQLSDGGMAAHERARRANAAIDRALGAATGKHVHIEQKSGRSIIFIGEQPVVELTADDAAVAGEGSLDLYAASVAARVTDILHAEEQRNQVIRTVRSIVYSIVSLVLALFLMQKLGLWTTRARRWVESNPQKMPAIRFKSIEVVRSPVLHGAALMAISVAKWFAYVGTVYTCLILVLSQFDTTRSFTGRLAEVVLSPISTLMSRVATLLPLSVIVAIGAVVLLILLRFIALFFASVERGETPLDRLSPTLAAPTSLIVRFGLVIAALLLAPTLTGNVDGTFAKLGQLAVAAVGLATVPIITTVLIGMRVLYTGRLAVGQWVSIGAITGRVLELTLFETRVWSSGGFTARVPHLSLLWQPVRTIPGNAHQLTLVIKPTHDLAGVVGAMSTLVNQAGSDAQVTVQSVSADRVSILVQVVTPETKDKNSLLFELLHLLAERGVALAE